MTPLDPLLPPTKPYTFPLSGKVAFAGSRHGSPYPVEPVVSSVLAAGGSIRVGCAKGVDQAVRASYPLATVLYASSFGVGKWSFAARTRALVSASTALCLFPPDSGILGPGSSLALTTAIKHNLPIFCAGIKPTQADWQPYMLAGVAGFVLLPQSKLFSTWS